MIGVQSIIAMDRPVITIISRELGYRFMAAEAWWILSGDNKVATLAPYSKMITQFSDDGITFFGAYGPKILGQLGYVTKQLIKDADTRQAVINIWRESPQPSKDIPCTLSTQFLIREGRLNIIHTMRSSDLWLGYPYDVFSFSMLATWVIIKLRRQGHYDLKLGDLYFTAGSQHIYERDFTGVDRVLSSFPEHTYRCDIMHPEEFRHEDELVSHLALLKDNNPMLMKTPHQFFRSMLDV
jgi:thymidylate synthase